MALFKQEVSNANTRFPVLPATTAITGRLVSGHQRNQIIGNGDYVLSSAAAAGAYLHSRDPTQLPFQASTTVLGYGETDTTLKHGMSPSATTRSPAARNEVPVQLRNLAFKLRLSPFTATDRDDTARVRQRYPSNKRERPSTSGQTAMDQSVRQQQIETADTLKKGLGRHQLVRR